MLTRIVFFIEVDFSFSKRACFVPKAVYPHRKYTYAFSWIYDAFSIACMVM